MLVRNSSELGILIRSTRKTAGLTQAELAQKVEVSTRWIVEMERGKDTVELRLVFRVLSGLRLLMDISPSTTRPQRAPRLAGKARAKPTAQGALTQGPCPPETKAGVKTGPSMQDVLGRLDRKA